MGLKQFTLTLVVGLFGAGATYAASPEITRTSEGLVTTTYRWDFSNLGATFGGEATIIKKEDGSTTLVTDSDTVFGETTPVLKAVNFYELKSSILHDWVISANTAGGGARLEFSMDLNMTSNSSDWQTILHVGAVDKGLTLGVDNGGRLVFASNSSYSQDVSNLTLSANTWTHVCFTLEGGVATITAGNETVTVNNMSDIVWADSDDENSKYSIGVKAPGYTDFPLSTLQVANMSVSLTTPEPTTATLSLLALAGLAARRRRRIA